MGKQLSKCQICGCYVSGDRRFYIEEDSDSLGYACHDCIRMLINGVLVLEYFVKTLQRKGD